jgi:hypothetical protein
MKSTGNPTIQLGKKHLLPMFYPDASSQIILLYNRISKKQERHWKCGNSFNQNN